jgi:hypothetical protein
MAHDFISVAKTGIQLITSATSAGATIPLDSAGNVPRFIRIAATQPACVRMGVGTQTAVVTDLQVQPGDAVVISTNGQTHIAAIQVSVGGVVQVSPMELM